MPNKLTHYLIISIIFISLMFPFSEPAVAQNIVVTVEDPQLHPPFNNDCPTSYWYPFDNNRGHKAYLTLNADAANSANYGEWHPLISQAGYYRVEAYVSAHGPITWCSGQNPPTIQHDTTDAHYTVHHANGVTNRTLSQYPLSNQWLDLGEYYFNTGQTGYITLVDLNDEPKFTTTISFSAMRFTFTRPTRPNIYLPFILYTSPSNHPPYDVGVIQDQGFDACHLPEISEMQAWWNHSPYSFYALYIGGISLYSGCAIASSNWINSVHAQGWSFVPTWVGPQAPCSTWAHKMSHDPAISYLEGRSEAQAASSAAATMGLTNSGLGGTIIYYDMEAYGVSTQACRQPVAAFINGWVQRLHELGNLAGGYGTRNSFPGDWAEIANVPADVWPASWYSTTYNPYASVNGIPWIEGLWTNHQRIRQYAGDVGNTWGGVSLSIDIDVADGQVAMPPITPLFIPTVIPAASIENAGWLSANQGWLVSGNHLYWTETGGGAWQDISPASIQIADFLPSGEAWALSTIRAESVALYHSADRGLTWESMETSLPPGNWYPLQLDFTTPSTGWVVVQLQTSQVFDYALLMKTRDGGLTWQIYTLPSAAPIEFISASEGWLIDRHSDALYRTLDGGLTWQTASQEQFPHSEPALPENTILSGWQADGLGWATTSVGDCSGEKGEPGFVCLVENGLWQSQDGGQTWKNVSLPPLEPAKP